MKNLSDLLRQLSVHAIEPELLKKIESEDCVKSNYKTIQVFSLIGSACVFLMLVISFTNPVIQRHRLVYSIGVAASLLLFVCNEWVHRHHPEKVFWLVYVSMAIYLSYGIALGTYTDPGMQSSTFMVMMIFVPLLFIDRPHRISTVIVVFDVVFILLARHVKSGAVLTADTTDAIIFGILALISSSYMLRIKYQRYVYERKMYHIGNTDQLTGLKNRNCYENEMASYGERCAESLSLVYVDVNGLHELNNSSGHSAGDDMLKFVARCLRQEFGLENTYRIGGDEFVSFVMDTSAADLQAQMDIIQEKLKQKDYYISCGIGTQQKDGLKMEELIRAAERIMYAQKAQYYMSTGRDRRKSAH